MCLSLAELSERLGKLEKESRGDLPHWQTQTQAQFPDQGCLAWFSWHVEHFYWLLFLHVQTKDITSCGPQSIIKCLFMQEP